MNQPPNVTIAFFGYLRVEQIVVPSVDKFAGLVRPHPHTIGQWNGNNTIYQGDGEVAKRDHNALRLTQPGGPLCHWTVPDWLQSIGLSYHGNTDRWLPNHRLHVVARGQEFVADIADHVAAHDWLQNTIEKIRT